MVARVALWVRLLFLLFSRVKVDRRWVEQIREESERGVLVHICEVESALDLALLSYLFLRNGIPLARGTNTRVHLFLTPIYYLLALPVLLLVRAVRRQDPVEHFCMEVASGRPGLLFLKRARFAMVPGGNIAADYLKALVQVQRAMERPIVLIPQVIFWTKGSEKYRKSVLDLLLGDPNAAGVRKLITFLARPSRAHVTCGASVSLKEVLMQVGDGDDDAIVRKATWLLHRSIDREERVTRGPMLKSSRQIRSEMMSSPDFVSTVEEIGREEGMNPKKAKERASRIILEIAADFRDSYIEALSFLLTPVFKRVFSSFVVDREAISLIKEVSRDSPVVLVPCHRSYMDYLVISYLLYLLGVNPPHIAIGANLSFFPLGHLFRHSGAFFVRRKISGERMYSYVLAQYIRKLLKEGYPLELFIEGGRSRTGRTFFPRFGLLNYVVDAVTSQAVRDVTVIPIALSYERIIEGERYAQEVSGKEKRKEDIASLVKSAKVLDSRYGRLYLTAGRAVRVADYLEKTAGKPVEELNEEERRYLVQRLGYLILSRINRATVVNPSGLVATALLTHHRRGISKKRFQEVTGFLLEFASSRGYSISLTLERALKASIAEIARSRERSKQTGDPRLVTLAIGKAIAPVLDETLDALKAQGNLEIEIFGDAAVFSIKPSARILLDYYRNNILHVYQREALVACSIYTRRFQPDEIKVEEVADDVKFFSKLFKKEFIFRVGDFTLGIRAGLASLEKLNIIVRTNSTLRVVPENLDRLILFRNLVLPIIESYLICARYAPIVRWKGALRQKELARAILTEATKEFRQGELTCQESLSTVNIVNALERFTSMGILKKVESGIDAGKIRFARGSSLDDLARLEKRLAAFARN